MRLHLILALALATVANAQTAPTPDAARKSGYENSPRATVIHTANVYIAADDTSQRIATVMPGHEVVILEKSGPWIRVFANTDVEEVNEKDKPIYGSDTITPPVSGWIQARGVVRDTTPDGDKVLMGEAATMEILAEDARGPRNAGQTARLLYRRIVEFYPNSPLVAEAAWRAGRPWASLAACPLACRMRGWDERRGSRGRSRTGRSRRR